MCNANLRVHSQQLQHRCKTTFPGSKIVNQVVIRHPMRHSSCYEVLLLVLTHIKAMTPPDLYRHQFAYWRYRSMEAVSSHFLQPFPTGPAKVIGQETAEFSSGFSAIIPHKLVVKINCSSVYGLWTDHNMFEWATTDPRTSSSTQVHRSTARTLHTPGLHPQYLSITLDLLICSLCTLCSAN